MHIWQSVYWFQSPSLLISTQLENSRGPTHVETTSLGQHKQTIHDSNLLRDCGQPIFTQNVWCNWKAHDVSVSNSCLPAARHPIAEVERQSIVARFKPSLSSTRRMYFEWWVCVMIYIYDEASPYLKTAPPPPAAPLSSKLYPSIYQWLYLSIYLSIFLSISIDCGTRL